MAAYSQTIRNGVGIVGGGPASLWNAFNWGAFKWGEGTRDIGQNVVKGITNALTPATAHGFGVRHLISESFTPAAGFGLTVRHLISESLTATGDMASERVYDGAGYQRNFPDRTPEGESRTFATWSTPASSVSGWSAAGGASTTWSDA